MATSVTIDPQIAAGHNNAAGLTQWTTLTAGGISFVEPYVVFSQTRRAQLRVGLNGYRGRVGKPSQVWVTMLTLDQWNYLESTYESVNGQRVTIRTTLDGDTYANYNATIELQDFVDMDYRRFAGALWKTTRSFAALGFAGAQITLTGITSI